jgi:hypothetical protein
MDDRYTHRKQRQHQKVQVSGERERSQEIRDESLDALIAASPTVDAFFRNLDTGLGRCVDVPSVVARRNRQFVRVPLPLLEALMPLPGKALGVYQLLWRRHHMEQKPATVQVTAAERQRCRLTRWQLTHALKVLEQAGFISLESRVGKTPRVTLRVGVEPASRPDPAP